MAEPGAGKMEKADKGAAKPAPAPAEVAVASTERKAALFSLKAAAATIGGGLLTWGFTVAQIAYTDHLAVLQRQADQGIAFQREVFALTGQIENQAIDVFNAAQFGAPEEAAALEQRTLHISNEQWRQVRLWFRIRGAQIYGRRVGDLVYDPDEEAVDLDECAVERPIGRPAGHGDCARRQAAEAQRLVAIVARVRTNRVAGDDTAFNPASFQTNLRLMQLALDAYMACLEKARTHLLARQACAGLERIVGSRLQLMTFSREDLSSKIMESSALRD